MIEKQQLIDGFSAMNLKAVEKILVNNAFKGFSNDSFLEKLDNVFSELKARGNIFLEVYKGIGVCSCNKDKKVLCFVGNKTNDYFTLRYQEDENNFYNFSRSCNEVKYGKPLELNEFFRFSIDPESTLEYKKHKEVSNPIREYKAFSSKSICSMENIELWLEKYRNKYNAIVEVLGDERHAFKLNKVELLVKKEFEVLYGKMTVLSKIYKREPYFKQQLKDYNVVKDSITKLKEWFDYQYENKNEYKLFSSVFYDSRDFTHFNLKLDELTLNPEDFKHTLKYMGIIEDAKAIQFEGTIKSIDDLEVHKKTETTRAYTKRKIVLSINDFCCSEYQVAFTDGRVKQLDNFSAGQFVKVLARLTGGEWENPEGIKEYKHSLFGWRLEKLVTKPTIQENKEEMDLYYKYILPLPF